MLPLIINDQNLLKNIKFSTKAV
jgi:hypothetical protein